MTLSPDDVETVMSNPHEAVKLANLRYVSENLLSIERKKVGRGFAYYKKEEKISDKKTLERIKELVIPPAWKDVKITHLSNGHLQVVGRDEKERKQYLYHATWSKIRNQTKFFKMTSFGKMLPKIRKQVDSDLSLEGMPKRKVLALVIRLMEETHIRVGNHYYAKNNKTYGLSTFRTRHVKTFKNGIKFEFIGKKGKEHSITVEDKLLIDLINQCEEIPGWELFKFYNENGEKQSIDSEMINDYIHEISGDMYSAKDFRTWSASKIFFETLIEKGYIEDEKENKKNILEGFDAAAEGLGNTRAVCRSYYIHPKLIETYETGEIIPYFKKVKEDKAPTYAQLSETEKVIHKLIKDYKIKIED
ncbi:DNA topoisomerase IB [Christiangramia forsetii]|uniref:DNA topoisomerase n=2 Tax=Christiangramia forsetii TaxID=411153 RepID=A0M2M3_CHRFK|nr:DNA topoisomerase IB [Christiangramia forsetii]GGG44018.1 DNA topoisomerase [Christiangramia forsetii]CAL66868.1 eukaryotic DNA topoisomerase I-like protein [Christiangramia forsetii KT0803]